MTDTPLPPQNLDSYKTANLIYFSSTNDDHIATLPDVNGNEKRKEKNEGEERKNGRGKGNKSEGKEN